MGNGALRHRAYTVTVPEELVKEGAAEKCRICGSKLDMRKQPRKAGKWTSSATRCLRCRVKSVRSEKSGPPSSSPNANPCRKCGRLTTRRESETGDPLCAACFLSDGDDGDTAGDKDPDSGTVSSPSWLIARGTASTSTGGGSDLVGHWSSSESSASKLSKSSPLTSVNAGGVAKNFKPHPLPLDRGLAMDEEAISTMEPTVSVALSSIRPRSRSHRPPEEPQLPPPKFPIQYPISPLRRAADADPSFYRAQAPGEEPDPLTPQKCRSRSHTPGGISGWGGVDLWKDASAVAASFGALPAPMDHHFLPKCSPIGGTTSESIQRSSFTSQSSSKGRGVALPSVPSALPSPDGRPRMLQSPASVSPRTVQHFHDPHYHGDMFTASPSRMRPYAGGLWVS